MRTAARNIFTTIRTEGALLPADFLQHVAEGNREIEGLSPDSYHLVLGEKLNEAINRTWNRLLGAWTGFKDASEKLGASDLSTGLTRERWLLPLFQELGYGRLQTAKAFEIDGKSYPISHGWQGTPIHLVGCKIDLDRRTSGVVGAARTSPHGLVQEMLNRSEAHLWGFVSNGHRLRVLRDNITLTRQAYVEFDLAAMFDGEVYADFVVLWLLCHQSRVEGERPELCWLEKWSQLAEKRGTRVLDDLRTGVEAAINALGSGFLAHTANRELRTKLSSATFNSQDYYRQLLRVVYRILFLFVAEDRGLLFEPKSSVAARALYSRFYSVARLRRLAERRTGTQHPDLWRGLTLVLEKLDTGCEELALPALGSFLWSREATTEIAVCELANRDLLKAIHSLAFTVDGRVRRLIDYKNLGAEELGSIYEALLELHPQLNVDAATFTLSTAAGNERKTTGSYYTPTGLVNCLLDSALDPVLDEACKKPKPERALLDLKICDPATGSGHFLIAAAHRLAKRLAASRVGDEEPSPEATRTALRDVIGRCLYGVDVNPMAVELCKVSLWMEALEPGKPLSFLDHRIKAGNSLLGALPELITAGLPDEAFTAIEGDDKKACALLKKRNKVERGGSGPLFARQDAETEGHLQQAAAALADLPEDRLQDIRRKETAFLQSEQTEEYRYKKQLADAWCAAFIIRKYFREAGIKRSVSGITHGLLNRLAERSVSAHEQPLLDEIERLAGSYRFFHWHLAFPEVLACGGFDVVLGNPPWERVKLQEEEFFAVRDPEIGKAKNAAARKKIIATLPETNPILATEWASAVRVAASESAFFRLSARYPFGGVGDVNTYAVFADLFRQLTNPNGAAAILLPNGLVTGFTYRAFLRNLLQSRTLASFYGFENEDKIFPDVHNETKFGVLTMTGVQRPVDQPWFTAHIRQPDQVHDPLRRYSLTAGQIETINPNTLNLPAFRWAADAEVAASIHSAAPILMRRHEDGRVENSWGIGFRTMFHMANDSGLFLDNADVAPRIIERRGARAVLDDGCEVYPLCEGKMLWHFDHRYGTYMRQTDKQANKGVLPHVDDTAHDNPEYRIQPRYWVDADKVQAALGSDASREWFFAWRDTGISERTFIGSIVPRTAAGHKAPLMTTQVGARETAALVAILSSLTVDFDARQKSNLMTFFVVEQLAVFTREMLAKLRPWLGRSASEWLADRVHELVYTNVELAPFARDLGNSLPPFRWLPERRALLQAEIDGAVLHLYQLTRAQAEWILDSFTVLGKYEESDHGEFRTKRLVLETYDALAEAKRIGQPYKTRLDPPPAAPSCSHPERALR